MGRQTFEAKEINIRRFDKNLTYYFISFNKHSNSYSFYDVDVTVSNSLNLFSAWFVLGKKVCIKRTFSIINYQPPLENCFVEITDNRI